MTKNWKKNTAIFLSSQAVSLFGSSLVQFAMTWYITMTTQSGIYATLSIVFGVLPTFFLAPFAGVWADRYNRRTLIIISDGMIAFSTLVLAIVFLTGYKEIWLLFAIAFIRALGSAVQMPCVNAMLPSLVPAEHLTRVNGINGSLQSMITLLSPMLSGALLGMASLESIFFIDVVTAAIAIIIMLTLFVMPAKEEKLEHESAKGYFSEMAQGLKYLWKMPFLRSMFFFFAIFMFMAAPAAFLTPLQVTRFFGNDVWRLTAIEVIFSVGMMFGGILMASWGGLKNKTYSMVMGCFLFAVSVIALGFPGNFYIYLALMALCGFSMPLFNTPATVILQEKVDPAYMGRVFGVIAMLNTGMMPLGMMVFGPMADFIDIRWLLIGTGIVILLVSFLMMINRPLVKAGIPVKREETPTEDPPDAPSN